MGKCFKHCCFYFGMVKRSKVEVVVGVGQFTVDGMAKSSVRFLYYKDVKKRQRLI